MSSSLVRRVGLSAAAVLVVIGFVAVPTGPVSAVPPPPNDDFATAQVLPGTSSGTVSGTNVDAEGEPDEPAPGLVGTPNSVWYSWTAPTDGVVVFDTCSATRDFDTVLSAYTGAAVNALAVLISNDDNNACAAFAGESSWIRFPVTAGTTYRIQVDGNEANPNQGAADGVFDLNWELTAAEVAEFSYTGAAQRFPVPAGVCAVEVWAVGAAGADGAGHDGGQPQNAAGGPGGRGGTAIGTIAVNPGEVLEVFVGGPGGLPSGGFNGGGDGGDEGGDVHNGYTGGGGGASDVRRSPWSLANRLIVAGGGGGGAGGSAGNPGFGGDGGGLAGADGDDGGLDAGGDGGTQIAGGGGGAGEAGEPEAPGTDGGFGAGGDAGRLPDPQNPGFFYAGGGGGGGGWYGGGGGGTLFDDSDEGVGGGGGGGSGFGPAGTYFDNLDLMGDARVSLVYHTGGCVPYIPPPTPPPPPPPPPAATCFKRPVTVDLALGHVPTAASDVIRGTVGDDVIDALGGNDIVCALGGDDVVRGNPGRDTLFGGAGDDTVRGNAGDDILRGRAGDDVLRGGAGSDTCWGGTGTDTAFGCETTREVP